MVIYKICEADINIKHISFSKVQTVKVDLAKKVNIRMTEKKMTFEKKFFSI